VKDLDQIYGLSTGLDRS